MKAGALESNIQSVGGDVKPNRKFKITLQAFMALCALTVSSDAFCQLTNATGKLTELSTWLAGIGLTIFTIALMYVGYKMVFAGAAFRDVLNILIGGFLVGGAAGLASFVAS